MLKVKLYLPAGAVKEAHDRAIQAVLGVAPGATLYAATGAWKGAAGLVTEPVTVVEVFCADMMLPTFRAIAAIYKEEACQEAVLMVVEPATGFTLV